MLAALAPIHSPPNCTAKVLVCAAVVAIALLGEPGPPAPRCPAGRQAFAHSYTLPTLSSVYMLTNSPLAFWLDYSVVSLQDWSGPGSKWTELLCSHLESLLISYFACLCSPFIMIWLKVYFVYLQRARFFKLKVYSKVHNFHFFTWLLFLTLHRCSHFSPFACLYAASASVQPLPLLPSGHHQTVVSVYGLYIYVLWLIPSPLTSSPLSPFPSDSCQSVLCVHASVSIFFHQFILFIRFHI